VIVRLGAAALIAALTGALLATSPRAAAAPIGDYRHDYLLPDERDAPIRVYGFLGGSWISEKDRSRGTAWRADFTDRASSGLWIAGTLGGRLTYFAEGAYFYEREEASLSQARADLRLLGEILHVRGGRFFFPFGVEARMASPRASPFILRPHPRSGPSQGGGVFGELWDGALNYSAAIAEDFPSGLADTIFTLLPGTTDEAIGGRIALSPLPGIEIGGSYAEEDGTFPSVIRGVDFSARGGPVFLVAEWGRLRRDERGSSRQADLAYGRIGHRIVEFSRHFEAIELLAGADYLDPDKERSRDRTLEYSGGVSISPFRWMTLKLEYHLVDREEVQADRILAETLFLW
jgi:hypothetical protein